MRDCVLSPEPSFAALLVDVGFTFSGDLLRVGVTVTGDLARLFVSAASTGCWPTAGGVSCNGSGELGKLVLRLGAGLGLGTIRQCSQQLRSARAAVGGV